MTNATDWITALIRRCESVGWLVERTKTSHFKVKDHHGKFMFMIPSSPSDKRARLNVEAEAKRHGLLDLEQKVKLRNEHDRLLRIQRDREASEAVEAEAALERIEADLNKIDKSVEHHPDLGDVDGIAITAIAPVMYKTPVMANPSPMVDAEELLLADERVVFRCAKPAAMTNHPELTGTCNRVFDTAPSLKAHITYHSRKTMPVPPNLRRKLVREAAESSTPTTLMPTPTEDAVSSKETAKLNGRADGHHPELDAFDHALSQLQTGIKRIADTLPSLIIEVGTLRDAARKLPVIDQEIVDKAAQFDALGAIFKNAAGK